MVVVVVIWGGNGGGGAQRDAPERLAEELDYVQMLLQPWL
jgi:hypothetical protein